MSDIDPIRLSKTMAYLLRHKPEHGDLEPDPDGWVPLAALASGASKLMRTSVPPDRIAAVVESAHVRRFEVEGERIRAVPKGQERTNKPPTPDILYHATTSDRAERAARQGVLSVGRSRQVYLSLTEAEAWRIAHKLPGNKPMVLYVDAGRARRRGVRIHFKRKQRLFVARAVPARHILNLQPQFAEQLSAGGIPVCLGDDGEPRLALIEVKRRSGVTWEVAKGKLEEGETPEGTAVREVQEEMGVDCDLKITKHLGDIRYGFMAPGGLPRLKTVYLYLMEPIGDVGDFCPSSREGIRAVRWFTADEACDAVTHTSLIPLMHEARRVLRGG